MTPEMWRQVSDAVDRAEQLGPEARRDFLEQLRRDAPLVRAEVEKLLRESPGENSTLTENPQAARQRLALVLNHLGNSLPPTGDSSPEEMEWPARIGRYRILDRIDSGGMGTVLRAEDTQLHRQVAVKILSARHRNNPELVRRFEEEALLTGQLQHPGIPAVHETGTLDDGRPFLAMKLIQGQTLARKLEAHQDRDGSGNAFSPELLADFEQVCQTVAYAHAHGVIHRDLKPHNIMVGAFGEVQVMDWGLAKMLSSSTKEGASPPAAGTLHNPRSASPGEETSAGAILGTRAYMPPEQARGEIEQLDQRCDVFALGAILCTLLTGEPPYRVRPETTGSTPQGSQPPASSPPRNWAQFLIRQTEEGDLTDAFDRLDTSGQREPGLKKLIELARACLAPRKEDRPRDAGEVAEGIARYRAELRERERTAELERTRTVARLEEEGKRLTVERQKRHMVVALLVALMLLLAGGAGVYFHYHSQRTAAERRHALSEQRISDALDQADTSRDELHALLGQPGGVTRLLNQPAEWEGRIASSEQALQQAQSLLATAEKGIASSLVERMKTLETDVQTEVGQFHLSMELEKIREKRASFAEAEKAATTAAQKYREAFLQAGLFPGEGEEEAVAERIRRMPIREQLLAGLDDWCLTLLHLPSSDSQLLTRLLDTARLVDGTALGRRLRDPDLWVDPVSLNRLAEELSEEELSPQLMHLLSDIAREVGAEAEPWLRHGQSRKPADFWLNMGLGYVLNETKPRDAAGFFRAALAVRPTSAAAWYNLATALQNQSDLTGAAHSYNQVLQIDPRHVKALGNLGVVYKARGDLNRSIATFKKAIDLDPRNAEHHYNLGLALLDDHDRTGATQAFNKAVELDPQFARAWNNIGSLHFLRNDLAAAVDAQHKAVESDPEFARAWLNLGTALLHQGKVPDAIEAYNKAIALDPRNALVWNDLGLALHSQNDLTGAADAFRTAIEIDPQFSNAHLGLGLVRIDQEDYSRAAASLQRGCNLLPPGHGLHGYARQQLQREELQQSLEKRLPPALAEPKSRPAELLALADWSLHRKKNYRDAVRLYEKAFAAQPQLASERLSWVRFDAARAAILLSINDGVGEADRADFRRKALSWFRMELTLWKDHLQENPHSGDSCEERLAQWKTHQDLASVREKPNRGSFPEEEQRAWERLWAEVDELDSHRSPER